MIGHSFGDELKIMREKMIYEYFLRLPFLTSYVWYTEAFARGHTDKSTFVDYISAFENSQLV